MRNCIGKNIISLLFLSAFLFLRVANVHTLSHYTDEVDKNDCELCEIITVSNQFTPFVDQIPDEIEIRSVVIPESMSLVQDYEEPLHSIASPDFVYNKPPPLV